MKLNRQSVKLVRQRWSWSMVALRAIAIIVVLALVPSIGPISSTPVSADSSPQCILNILYGYVDIRDAGSVDWEQGVEGMQLFAGTYVRTANKSWAKLTFFEGSILTLEPNTTIEIRNMDVTEKQDTIILLKQWIGRTWSRVVKMLGLSSRYEIQTPSANAVVRGTLFLTEVDDTETTTVQTREGLVSVTGQGKEVYVPAGKQTTVDSGMAPSKPVKASVSKVPTAAISTTQSNKSQGNAQNQNTNLSQGNSNSPQGQGNKPSQDNSPSLNSNQGQGNNQSDHGNKQSQGNSPQSNSQGNGNSPSNPGSKQQGNSSAQSGNQGQANGQNQSGNKGQGDSPPDQGKQNQGNSPPDQGNKQGQGNSPPDPGSKQQDNSPPDTGNKNKAK